jgi:hypothetical protein
MPTAAEEAYAVAKAAQAPDVELDWELYEAEYERRLAERQKQLLSDARASFRAIDGWGTVRDQADWEPTVEQARQDYDRGAFLLERLGAERHLDPPLRATLLTFRRRLIAEHDARTAAELMLIDSAVLAVYHQLRVNGWISRSSASARSTACSSRCRPSPVSRSRSPNSTPTATWSLRCSC